MRTLEKDYKYLLFNLIPHHRLSNKRRKSIEKAISSQDARQIRGVSILALEDLCESDFFTRTEAVHDDGHVALTYVRSDGFYQIRVLLPDEHWRELTNGQGPVPTPAETLPETAPPVGTTINILPEIIRSLAINDQRETTLQRLEVIVENVPGWLHFSGSRLSIIEGHFGGGDNEGTHIVRTSESALLEQPVYERVKNSRRIELLAPTAARSSGLQPPKESASGTSSQVELHVAVSPVFVFGQFCGILDIWYRSEEDDVMLRTRVKIATEMLEQILENASKLENLTSVDKLTGVYNRHFYDLQIRIETERATRSESKLSMLLLDIDDFKKINDTMGHQKGDEALVLIADMIRKNLRKIDLPFRYGGEEFVILLPGTAEDEAIHTAERLRSVISEYNDFVDPNGVSHKITVSIGAAVFPDHARNEGELFSKTDKALYAAKKKGKNQVVFHQD